MESVGQSPWESRSWKELKQQPAARPQDSPDSVCEVPFGEAQKQRESGVHGRGKDLNGLRLGVEQQEPASTLCVVLLFSRTTFVRQLMSEVSPSVCSSPDP